MLARFAVLSLALLAATAAAATPAGWAPGDLAHRKGDERVQKGIKHALITPPKRALAEFTPVPQRGAVRRVSLPPGKKLVALTFDLCEQRFEVAGYQGGIVDILRRNGIKATFFVGGKWMLSHRERTQQLMADPLFEVANHSWEHRNLRVLSGQALVDEIGKAQSAYEQVREELEAKQCAAGGRSLAHEQAPKRLALMRFPYGACSAAALDEVARQGLTPIQWDVSSGDPTTGQSARAIEQQVLGHVRPGSIVLFHANGRGWHTEAALPAIIAALKAQGYEFATISELTAAGEPMLTATCYDSRPGDTDQWPRPALASQPGDVRTPAGVLSGLGWPWSGTPGGRATTTARR